MTLAQEITERLAVLKPATLELIDDSAKHAGHAGSKSGGKHFLLTISAACFNDLPTLARHRLVYDALGDLMHGPIHALAIVARSSNAT